MISVLTLALRLILAASGDEGIKPLRSMGTPGSYRDWARSHTPEPFGWWLAPASGADGSTSVAVVVQASLASQLTTELAAFRTDLESAGHSVYQYEVEGGTAESLRALLTAAHNVHGIEGALLVGDLPVAWFQAKNLYGEDAYGVWPTDLYYMDLDGVWLDSLRYDVTDTLTPGADSILDTHRGNVAPEIYVGRLTPTGLPQAEALRSYFAKDREYRHDTLPQFQRALVFVDDDWVSSAAGWQQDIEQLYPSTLLIADPESTRADVYRRLLDKPWAWVSVYAHSFVDRQYIYRKDGSVDAFDASDYYDGDFPVCIYNFFDCYFCRYTEDWYGGACAIFAPTHGLAAVGSTSSGGMENGRTFYEVLGQSKSLGRAFREWFADRARGGFSHSEVCWYYGMTLLGDPFLVPRHYPAEDTQRLYLTVSPNPVRGMAWTRFEVGQPGDVRLAVFDVAGRLCASYLNGYCNSGAYSVKIELPALPCGIYLLRLESLGRQRVVKIVRT